MEIILAIVVASAVIFFGALISMGNERQRKAIDSLREQLVYWAIQDLRIKRNNLNFENHITDPLGWLNKLVEKNYGLKTNLQYVEYFQYPQALVCSCEQNVYRFIFSPVSPAELRRIKKNQKSQLSNYSITNTLLSLHGPHEIHEVNALSADSFFSQELSVVWKLVTGEEIKDTNMLWIYQYHN